MGNNTDGGSKSTFPFDRWIGILGIAIALGTWWHQTKSRDFAATVSPAVGEIVKAGVVSDIAVTYRGTPITGSLRAYQVAIWNAGREAIRRDDILKPFRITWQPDAVVLDAKILRKTREEAGLQIARVTSTDHFLDIDLKIMERNDGALLQFLVSGDSKFDVSIEGTIVDQGKLDSTTFRAPVLDPAKGKLGQMAIPLLSAALLFMMVMSFVAIAIQRDQLRELRAAISDRRFSIKRHLFPLFPITFFAIFFMAFAMYTAKGFFVANSPFGF